ncbi:MAG: hypothetical protein K2O04_01775 [Clostridiales bacterium]|nr:hypothetical protein [Clostridiales bacterium]
MDKNFIEFKKRIWLYILIKCVAAALAAGFLAVNAVLLPCRLCGVDLFPLYYVPIALGGILLGGGIAFLVFRTDDGKIAGRLDDEFGLNERTQTALRFEGSDGVMPELQRENAVAALSEKSAKSLRFTNLVVTVLCAAVFVLGVVAVPIITVTIPIAQSTAPAAANNDPPRPITDWEWAALDDLIDYVRSSQKADAAVKSGMISELEGLKRVLLAGVSQSSINGFVQNTVTNIRNVVKDANESGSTSDSQRALNSEEETYVVNKLYEIFSLKQPSGDINPDEQPPDEPPPDDPLNPTPGEIDIDDTPFFDPELGYIKLGEAREEYYMRVQAALQQGTISREEWEHIMVTYFADLVAKDE